MRAAIIFLFLIAARSRAKHSWSKPCAALVCRSCAVWKSQQIPPSRGTRGFSSPAQSSASRNREPSTHQAAEDVFGAGAKRDRRLDIGRRARAQRAGDLDCGASLTALAESDGVRATLVGARLAGRAFRAIERRRRGGFPCLSAQLRVSDASFGDQFDER